VRRARAAGSAGAQGAARSGRTAKGQQGSSRGAMPCCFGGAAQNSVKEPLNDPEAALATVREEEAAAAKAEEEARQREEEARIKAEAEEARLLAEARRRAEEEVARLEAIQRELEEASARRTAEARARAGVDNVVVRKELRQMSPKEQRRFCDALHKLMDNRDNAAGSSEFFRIAGQRGWPSELSQRGEETFPAWHRGHLLELERALKEADKELGNDGDIGLPYWDWLNFEVGGEVVPKCIRDSFATLPWGLVDPEQAGDLGKHGFSQLASDAEIKSYLANADIRSMVTSCLSDGTSHWMHASKRCRRRGFSLEACHDLVCLACGFPLSDAAYGGFHPCYFLHQCNIDRIYEQYLQLEAREECEREFQQRQEQLHENRGEPNRFTRALEPFKHPTKRRPLLPAETLSTSELGYIYDELPSLPLALPSTDEFGRRESPFSEELMRTGTHKEDDEEPIYAAFRGLSQSTLGDNSYSLHVFVTHRDAAASWKPPMPVITPTSWEAPRAAHMGWEAIQEYAALGSGFSSSGSASSSSGPRQQQQHQQQPYDVLVEVQGALRRLQLKCHDAELHVLCVDQLGKVLQLEDTPLPPPTLIGPVFNDMGAELREGREGGEVSRLQRSLAAWGFDPGQADGTFGPKTHAAVVKFQEFAGLKPDGVAGRATKAQLIAQRKDLLPDLGATALPKRFVEGETVHYAVLTLPGHLDHRKTEVLEEVNHAFAQWGQATNLTFAMAEDGGPPPALTLRFEDLAEHGAAHHGGLARPGGQLSQAAKDGITFDTAEHWLLRGQLAPRRRPQAVRFYPVLLHAIGHCLGLPHSSERESAMWPYYDNGCKDLELTLTEGDRLMARSMVKNTQPCGCDLREPEACALQ